MKAVEEAKTAKAYGDNPPPYFEKKKPSGAARYFTLKDVRKDIFFLVGIEGERSLRKGVCYPNLFRSTQKSCQVDV